MKKDGVLHKILYAHALNLLQEIPISLLPCSEVDLCDMSGQAPEHNAYQVNYLILNQTSIHEDQAFVLLVTKLQLVFKGAMNSPDEVQTPAEKKHQESLSL